MPEVVSGLQDNRCAEASTQRSCEFPHSHLSLPDGIVDLLLVTVHLYKGADLGQVNRLSVAESNNFIKRKDKVEGIIKNVFLVQVSAIFWDNSGKQAEGLEVLQDVGGLCCDEQHVEALQGLVHVSHAVRLHEGVLLPCCHQLWEGSDESLRKR